MAATESLAAFGRIAVQATPATLLVTIGGNGATYATASGGLPIDLTTLLQQGQANNDQTNINPADVVGFIPLTATSPGKYEATTLVVGTPTYTPGVGSGYASAAGLPPAGSSQGSDPQQTLATCPATLRLYNGTTEFADGACSEIVTGLLVIARGGVNP